MYILTKTRSKINMGLLEKWEFKSTGQSTRGYILKFLGCDNLVSDSKLGNFVVHFFSSFSFC